MMRCKRYHKSQASDEWLDTKAQQRTRILQVLKDAYDKAKIRVTYYVDISHNNLIKAAGSKKVWEEQTSVKTDAD